MYCTIRVRGSLSPAWSDWLHGLSIAQIDADEAVLSGQVADQSALLGILNRIHAMNVRLIAVEIVEGRDEANK